MADINRLGLGTMGMHFGNREKSVKTIHAALDAGHWLKQANAILLILSVKDALYCPYISHYSISLYPNYML